MEFVCMQIAGNDLRSVLLGQEVDLEVRNSNGSRIGIVTPGEALSHFLDRGYFVGYGSPAQIHHIEPSRENTGRFPIKETDYVPRTAHGLKWAPRLKKARTGVRGSVRTRHFAGEE
jgi:hypothetical protein